MRSIFEFMRQGVGRDSKVEGEFIATGVVPRFYSELEGRGVKLDHSIFTSRSRQVKDSVELE